MLLYDLINLLYNDDQLYVKIFYNGHEYSYTKGSIPYKFLRLEVGATEIDYEEGVNSFVFLKIWLGE